MKIRAASQDGTFSTMEVPDGPEFTRRTAGALVRELH